MPPDAQKAFSKLQARRQNYGQYEFVTDTDLREVWNEDFLTEFFSYPGEDLSDDEYKRIRDGSIKMLSILVAIGWKDWVRAKVWLAAPTPRLEDSMLPLDRVDFEHIPELSALDIDNFRLRQREYNPIVIRENMMSEDLSGRILPITETSCSIGRGAYGDVTKVQVAKRQFQDANGNRNEKSQVFALKKLKIKNEGEECEEVKNLRLLKLDCRTDTRISIHKAIFVYDGLYHILYDLAQANFREFLEEEEFERYLRPNDCIHPLFEATWELSNALTFLHTGLGVKGVKFICCHMDLKPENILVFIKDGKFSLKIADFGISRFKPDPHAQGDEIRDVHSYQSGSTTGTMPRRYPWEFAAPEMCGKKVGRKIDVWALGCILIIITIRAFRGIEWLKRFEFNKGDESGRYKDDRFYHHRTESVSREYELKPDVNEWLDLLSHGDDSYLGPLEELGLGKKAAKKILSKLHSLICDSLVIDSKARISSAKLADDLYKIKGGIPASPFHQLKIEDTLDTMEGEAPDNLLSMISGPGLRLYELCAKRCHLDERCSVDLIRSQIGLLCDEKIISKACSLVSGPGILNKFLSYHETCAVAFLVHVHVRMRSDIMVIPGFTDLTRTVFGRFAVWVSCNCGLCDVEWNFSCPIGIARGNSSVHRIKCQAKAFKKQQPQASDNYTKTMWEKLKQNWHGGV